MKYYDENTWNNTKEAGEFENLPMGAYVCKITKVTDVAEKEYLEIEFDICEGQYKDYGKNFVERTGWNTPLKVRKSYKEKALSFFKSFINAVEQTNAGYTWRWEEQSLVNKGIGIILDEEEYVPTRGKHAGEISTRLVANDFTTANKVRKNECREAKHIPLKADPSTAPTAENGFAEVESEDLPF